MVWYHHLCVGATSVFVATALQHTSPVSPNQSQVAMKPWILLQLLPIVVWISHYASAFQNRQAPRSFGTTNCPLFTERTMSAHDDSSNNVTSNEDNKDDNKAMAFLRKIGRVGGPQQDFRHVIGVDEGSVGKAASSSSSPGGPLRKALSAFRTCTETGVIDDLSETFPTTSCGTTWAGYTDQVMGGVSSAILTREPEFHGRTANVLRGRVSLENNGGFIQMATNLAKDPKQSPTVDASNFDGVELDVLYDGQDDQESFNIHLKTDACERPYSSYRATFEVPHGEWKTVQLPWSEFVGKGPGASETPFNRAALKRIGLVAIGKPMERLVLAISGMRLYKKTKPVQST